MRNESDLADLFEKDVIDKKDFSKAFNSKSVTEQVKKAEQRVADYKPVGVPEIVVNGRYRIGRMRAGGQAEILAVADFLITKGFIPSSLLRIYVGLHILPWTAGIRVMQEQLPKRQRCRHVVAMNDSAYHCLQLTPRRLRRGVNFFWVWLKQTVKIFLAEAQRRRGNKCVFAVRLGIAR